MSLIPRGLRHTARSISFVSPMVRFAVAFEATKIASLILRPERRFLDFTSFQRRIRPSLSFGNSSRISLRRQSFSFSRARLRPPGNIQRRSRLRRTKRTLPRLTAASFEDLAMMPLKMRNDGNALNMKDNRQQSDGFHVRLDRIRPAGLDRALNGIALITERALAKVPRT